MNKYRYFWSRYHNEDFDSCGDLEEAIGRALADIESGEAWPLRIEENGVAVWEQEGAIATEQSLINFKRKRGLL